MNSRAVRMPAFFLAHGGGAVEPQVFCSQDSRNTGYNNPLTVT